jgi:hypothetical protein
MKLINSIKFIKLMAHDYHTVKFKLESIVNDPKLVGIINNLVIRENKIIFEGVNLFNNYIFYCLDNNIPVNIDTTLIRQCCMFILDANKKLGKIKVNFPEPDITDKSEKEIAIIVQKHNDKILRSKEVGGANRNRVDIIRLAYNNYFPKENLDKFSNKVGIMIPIELFSNTFLTNIENHITYNYFKFQLKYLSSITKKELIKFDLVDKQISTISRYIQKCITINEKIDFVCNDNLTIDIFSKIKSNVNEIIREQIKLVTIKRCKYIDLKLTTETSMFYKKRYEQSILKKSMNDVIKYYGMMSKYLTDNNEKSFTVIPQLTLGYQHIMISDRIMSALYNAWKNKKLSVKSFDEKYDEYFNEIFNLKKKCVRLYAQGNKPKVLSTDGYSVSVMFVNKEQIVVENTNTKKGKKNLKIKKINLSTLNNGNAIKGMYDADDITCSDEYLNKYHKKGIDSGNQYMISQVSEADRSTIITKGYYNELSHINLNKRKQERLIKDCKMDKIFEELSNAPRITTKYQDYNKYILIVRKYKLDIFAFYGRDDVRGLKYDTYVNKRSAICKIVRELIPGVRGGKRKKEIYNDDEGEIINEEKGLSYQEYSGTGKHKGEHRKHKKDAHFDADKHEKIKGLPTIIAFGKGNGSLTINNTKGCTPHGPIKRIVKELSKVCLVILTKEDYSSQMCCKCETKLIHPKVIEDINKNEERRELIKEAENEAYITRMKRISDGRRLKADIKLGGRLKSRNEKKLAKLRVEYECYKLCCCKNKECGHKLWHRDINAAINMITIMTRTLTNKPLGAFEKKK